MLISLFTMAAQAGPDLFVSEAQVVCLWGVPTVEVVVKNNSPSASGAFYIDLFRGEPAVPPMGSLGERYVRVPGLAGYGAYIWSVEFANYPTWVGWVDVLVDTDGLVVEADETNNSYSRHLSFAGC